MKMGEPEAFRFCPLSAVVGGEVKGIGELGELGDNIYEKLKIYFLASL